MIKSITNYYITLTKPTLYERPDRVNANRILKQKKKLLLNGKPKQISTTNVKTTTFNKNTIVRSVIFIQREVIFAHINRTLSHKSR